MDSYDRLRAFTDNIDKCKPENLVDWDMLVADIRELLEIVDEERRDIEEDTVHVFHRPPRRSIDVSSSEARGLSK